jgi:hypothetical protein
MSYLEKNENVGAATSPATHSPGNPLTLNSWLLTMIVVPALLVSLAILSCYAFILGDNYALLYASLIDDKQVLTAC